MNKQKLKLHSYNLIKNANKFRIPYVLDLKNLSIISLIVLDLIYRQRPFSSIVSFGINSIVQGKKIGRQIFLSRFEVISEDDSSSLSSYGTTIYSSRPDRIKTKSDYRPTNCGEPKQVISNLSKRAAYRRATNHINEDPCNNSCTIEADSELKLYLWKATELPVKLTKDKSSTTFLYFKELKYLKC